MRDFLRRLLRCFQGVRLEVIWSLFFSFLCYCCFFLNWYYRVLETTQFALNRLFDWQCYLFMDISRRRYMGLNFFSLTLSTELKRSLGANQALLWVIYLHSLQRHFITYANSDMGKKIGKRHRWEEKCRHGRWRGGGWDKNQRRYEPA